MLNTINGVVAKVMIVVLLHPLIGWKPSVRPNSFQSKLYEIGLVMSKKGWESDKKNLLFSK